MVGDKQQKNNGFLSLQLELGLELGFRLTNNSGITQKSIGRSINE
jgi:hypothetical protein